MPAAVFCVRCAGHTIRVLRCVSSSGYARRIPNASIGSDIIVGFPGETEDDFGELASYLETSPLTHLHVFPYSDRPGTVASRLGDVSTGSL